ncbi:5023_t:CDS:1, partial [Gigaspora rosea]
LKRGIRQCDPLLLLLYILAFEDLLKSLYKYAQEIKVQNQFFKLIDYANDLLIEISSQSD